MSRETFDVAVIIPDASPVLTLARIGRVDLLSSFSAPIKIVDQAVKGPDEDLIIAKPLHEFRHDADGLAADLAAWVADSLSAALPMLAKLIANA